MVKTASEYIYSELKQSTYCHFVLAKYLFFSLIYSASFLTIELLLNDQTEIIFHFFSGVMALIVGDYLSSELLISIVSKIRKNNNPEKIYEFDKSNYLFLIPVVFLSFLNIFYFILFLDVNFFNIPSLSNVSIFFIATIFLYLIMRVTINKFISTLLIRNK